MLETRLLKEVAIMELGSILNVLGYFLVRVGLPIVLLVVLGILIDRWEKARRRTVDTSEFEALDAHHSGREHAH
jgi:hypothetical protein